MACLSVAAFAQSPPSLTIAFSAGSVVPVGTTGTTIAGILLALTAAWLLRKRATAARTMLGAAAVVAVVGAATQSAPTDAISVIPVNLVSSPTTITIGGGGGFYQFQNATSGPIIINAITLQNAGALLIDSRTSSCAPAISLAAGAMCTVSVSGGRE